MKYKFNPLTGEFNIVPDSGTLKQKLNWLTGNFNLTKDAGKYRQIYNVIEGEFNLYPTTTQVVIHGVGSIQLTNAVENGLLSLTAYGGTEQDLTPTPDNPVDIVSNNGVIKYGITSKNLLDMSESNIVLFYYINNSGQILYSDPNFYNSKYIPVKPSTTYTWSTSVKVSYLSIMEYDSNKQFLKRTLFTNDATTLSNKITLSANTAYVLLGSNMDSATITYEKISAVDRQFEEGNTATSYVPYEEGIYTDGTMETINVHTKNLLDPSKGMVFTTTQYRWYYSDGYTLKAGKTYTFSCDGGVVVYIMEKSDNTVLINRQDEATYTPTEDVVVYFRIYKSGGLPETFNAQLELGSTATEYQPYFDGGTATAEMLLKVGDYVDEQEILSGNITRKVGIRVLDGTETRAQGTTSQGVYRYRFEPTDAPKLDGGRGHCMSTHFFDIGGVTTQNIGGVFASTTYLYFIPNQDIDTVAKWTAFLTAQYNAGTPVIAVYPLATPTTETVAGQTMNIQDGSNTIEITQASIDNLELEATYEQEA